MKITRFVGEFLSYSLLYLFTSSSHPRTSTFLFILIYIYQICYLFRHDNFNKGKEFFSFNYLFFSMLTIITYLIPIFYLLGLDDMVRYICPASYEIQYIPKSLYITSIAILSYTYGFRRREKIVAAAPNSLVLQNINRNLCVAKVLSVIAFIFFLYQFSISYKTGMLDVEGFVVTLVSVALIYSFAMIGYSNIVFKYNLLQFILHHKFILLIALVIVLAMFSIGDRFFPLLIICSLAFVINHFVYKISLRQFFLSIIGGAVILFFISFTRFNDDKSVSNAIAQYNTMDNPAIVFQDVIPVNLDYYLGLHYVDHHGSYKPGRIIVYLLKPIPFVPSYLTNTFFEGDITTGNLLTEYNKKIVDVGSSTQGLGTHCIVDVYMSWGIVGVVLLFMIFGMIVGKCYTNANKFYSLLIYCGLMAGAIYIPRESLFSTYRIAIWLVVLAFFLLKRKKL